MIDYTGYDQVVDKTITNILNQLTNNGTIDVALKNAILKNVINNKQTLIQQMISRYNGALNNQMVENFLYEVVTQLKQQLGGNMINPTQQVDQFGRPIVQQQVNQFGQPVDQFGRVIQMNNPNMNVITNNAPQQQQVNQFGQPVDQFGRVIQMNNPNMNSGSVITTNNNVIQPTNTGSTLMGVKLNRNNIITNTPPPVTNPVITQHPNNVSSVAPTPVGMVQEEVIQPKQPAKQENFAAYIDVNDIVLPKGYTLVKASRSPDNKHLLLDIRLDNTDNKVDVNKPLNDKGGEYVAKTEDKVQEELDLISTKDYPKLLKLINSIGRNPNVKWYRDLDIALSQYTGNARAVYEYISKKFADYINNGSLIIPGQPDNSIDLDISDPVVSVEEMISLSKYQSADPEMQRILNNKVMQHKIQDTLDSVVQDIRKLGKLTSKDGIALVEKTVRTIETNCVSMDAIEMLRCHNKIMLPPTHYLSQYISFNVGKYKRTALTLNVGDYLKIHTLCIHTDQGLQLDTV